MDLLPIEYVPALLQTIGVVDQSGIGCHRCKVGRLIDVEVMSHGLRFNGHSARLCCLPTLPAGAGQHQQEAVQMFYRFALGNVLALFSPRPLEPLLILGSNRLTSGNLNPVFQHPIKGIMNGRIRGVEAG
jgi:hypothetical protein